jgi:hypothetical protein
MTKTDHLRVVCSFLQTKFIFFAGIIKFLDVKSGRRKEVVYKFNTINNQ